jgi:hypothetical protein
MHFHEYKGALQKEYESSYRWQQQNRVFHKIRKTQHQYPEFGPEPGEIIKIPAKMYITLQGGSQTQKYTTFCAKLSLIRFWPVFPFHERLHSWYKYIFTASTCTTTIITSNLAHGYDKELACMIFSISYPDLIKISLLCRSHSKRGYELKRVPKTGWSQDNFKENSNTYQKFRWLIGGLHVGTLLSLILLNMPIIQAVPCHNHVQVGLGRLVRTPTH